MFFVAPASLTHSKANVGFFEGYDTVSAKMVIICNAMIGLAISAVFKYADAVIKTFATAVVTVLLVIFSAIYFDQQPTLVRVRLQILRI
jgi:hypothetical protein